MSMFLTREYESSPSGSRSTWSLGKEMSEGEEMDRIDERIG